VDVGRWLVTGIATLGVLLGAAPAGAAVKTVTFDDLPAGTDVSNQYQTSHGVFFQGPSLGDGAFPNTKTLAEAHSPSQVGELPTIGESFHSYTVGRLNPTARTVSAFVGFTFGTPPSDTVTLKAYNSSSSSPIATSTVDVSQGAFTQQVSVTSPNVLADISYFSLESANSVIGMDDLAITTPDTPSPPDFGLAAPGDPANVPVGSFVDVPISLSRLNGSNGDVSLAVTNLPPGMRAEITPNPVTGTGGAATLRLSALDNADRFVDYREITITGTPGPGAGSGTRTVRKLVRIVDNCETVYRADFLDVRADCIKRIGPDKLQLVAQKARINGLLVEPASGDRTLTIDTKEKTITSDGDLFAIEPQGIQELQMYVGPINWDVGTEGSGPKSILDYDVTGVKKLKGIPIQRFQVSFTKPGKTQISPTLRLSFWPFDYIGALTSTPSFTVDNDNGPDFSGLAIKVDKVDIVGLSLKDVSVKYQSTDTWSGSAKVVLRFVSPYEVGAGFGLKAGGFDFLQGSVGNLNVAVGPAIFLQQIGFEVQRNPNTLAGTVGFSGGPSLAGKKAVTVGGKLKAVLADPWVVEVSGNAKVADRFTLGEAFARYTSGGLFELGGKASWDLSVASISGSVNGFVDGGHNTFDLEGSVRGCITVKYLPDPCAGASFLVSSIGIAACVDLTIVSGGVGYYWGGDFDLFGGSCDLSPWRPVTSSLVRAAGAGTARRYVLPANLPSAAFAVTGAGDAPGLTVTGPKGETVTVSKAAPFARAGNLVAMLSENGTTYVAIKRPSAGAWTITDDGAVPIGRVRQSVGLPEPAVRASVTGRGHNRTLRWRLKRIAGQRVTFVEAGKNLHKVIATTTKASGQAPFSPAEGPAGRRRIVALVVQNNLMRERITAGTYLAPPRLKPAKPRRLRIARRGSRLVVSWRAPRSDFRHAVHFKLGNGRQLTRVTAPRARSVTLRGVSPRFGAAVTVLGMTHANGRGRAARASIRGRPATRPRLGTWKVDTRAFVSTRKGSFRVIRRSRAISDLRLTPGGGAGDKCGTAELRVVGRPALSSVVVSGASQWIVGRRAPKSVDGATTRRVTVRRAGKNVSGSLKLVFSGSRKVTGALTIPNCDLHFNATR
jgi:hypothetical protein